MKYKTAEQCASSHFNQRPPKAEVSLLVIHNISLPPNQFDNHFIEDFFVGCLDSSCHPYFETIKDLRVSSHFLIKRSGKVVQFVDCDHRAWHAGESSWDGVANCNDYSIGIELQGTDDTPYTDQQYASLVDLTKQLMRHYPAITVDRIVGHNQIAPQRKTDPGESFDWHYYRSQLLD